MARALTGRQQTVYNLLVSNGALTTEEVTDFFRPYLAPSDTRRILRSLHDNGLVEFRTMWRAGK